MAAQSLRERFQKPFNDYKNYPYGFSRSGDFSIRESKLLQEKGCLLQALWEGKLTPSTEEEHLFIAMLHGEREPQTAEEKLWVKYLKRINRPHIGALNSGKPDSVEDDSSDELPLDDDDVDVVDDSVDGDS